MRRVLRIKIPQRVLKEAQCLHKSLHPVLLFNSRKPRFAIFDGWRISPDTKIAKLFFFAIFASFCSNSFLYLDFFISQLVVKSSARLAYFPFPAFSVWRRT
jgi:hypothetical protein